MTRVFSANRLSFATTTHPRQHVLIVLRVFAVVLSDHCGEHEILQRTTACISCRQPRKYVLCYVVWCSCGLCVLMAVHVSQNIQQSHCVCLFVVQRAHLRICCPIRVQATVGFVCWANTRVAYTLARCTTTILWSLFDVLFHVLSLFFILCILCCWLLFDCRICFMVKVYAMVVCCWWKHTIYCPLSPNPVSCCCCATRLMSCGRIFNWNAQTVTRVCC